MQHMDVNRRSEVTLWAKFKSQTAVFSDPDHPFRLHFRTLYELIKTKRLSEQSLGDALSLNNWLLFHQKFII